MTNRAAETLSAVHRMADRFHYADMADSVAHTLACGEAELLADVFRAAGHDDVAQTWLNAHVDHDNADMTGDEIAEAHGVLPGPRRCDCGNVIDHDAMGPNATECEWCWAPDDATPCTIQRGRFTGEPICVECGSWCQCAICRPETLTAD